MFCILSVIELLRCCEWLLGSMEWLLVCCCVVARGILSGIFVSLMSGAQTLQGELVRAEVQYSV